MAIKPTDILQTLGRLEKNDHRSKTTTPPGSDFAGVLAAVSADRAVEPRALAELCRLEMLRGSVAFAADNDPEPGFSLPLPALKAYATAYHLPTSQKTDGTAPPSPSRLDSRESASPSDIVAIAHRAAQRFDIDPALVKAVIKAESDFDPGVVSTAGARGLMQLMPDTARDLGVQNPFDPEQNVMGGTHYLKQLLDKYDGDLDKTLAAYNWGPGNVDRKGTATLPEETRTYLSRVKRFQSEFLV
ncbi:MAG: lytic transglycosylase domain-containing protein [Desulfuromonadaceae bacterium]